MRAFFVYPLSYIIISRYHPSDLTVFFLSVHILLLHDKTACCLLDRPLLPLCKRFLKYKKKEKGKMLALRLARIATRPARRCLATATANHADVASSSSSSSSSAAAPPSVTSSRVAPIPLSNVEALWTKLSGDEKVAVHEKLEALQLKDWKTLSVDEKKAG